MCKPFVDENLCGVILTVYVAVLNLRKSNVRTLKQDFVLFYPLGGFSQEELLKIWKGLFYCMWVQDEPLLQVTCTSLCHITGSLA